MVTNPLPAGIHRKLTRRLAIAKPGHLEFERLLFVVPDALDRQRLPVEPHGDGMDEWIAAKASVAEAVGTKEPKRLLADPAELLRESVRNQGPALLP